jgi:hypothetical protein
LVQPGNRWDHGCTTAHTVIQHVLQSCLAALLLSGSVASYFAEPGKLSLR